MGASSIPYPLASSGLVHDEFLKAVASLCDLTIPGADPNWRDRYYATDLDKVIAIFKESNIKQRQIDSSLNLVEHPNPSLSFGDQQRLSCNSAISETPTSDLGFTDYSPSSNASFSISDPISSTRDNNAFSFSDSLPSASSDTSYSFIDPLSSPTNDTSPSNPAKNNNNTNFRFSYVVFPQENRNSNPPPITVADAKPTELKLVIPPTCPAEQASSSSPSPSRCLKCDTQFTGNPRDQVTNLRRHMRNIHGQGPSLQCAEPQCRKPFRRSDNLRKHRVTVHGLVDPPVRKRGRRRDDGGIQVLQHQSSIN